VAILSKNKIEDVVTNLPFLEENEFSEDDNFKNQARYIEAVISYENAAIRVASIYVPNGGGEILENETLETSKKFRYKLDFFKRLKNHFLELKKYDEIQIFGGDFNVAVENIDVYSAKDLHNSVCFHQLERQNFREILNIGLIDSYREKNPNSHNFSWWDYRAGAWQHNKGMRIDYLLTSPQAADKIIDATIEDKNVRDKKKASDHCPVVVEIDL
jgi:exodeoxyribonuclease-3